MKVSNKDCSQIVITSDNGEVVAVISDEKIITHKGFKVQLS